MIKLINMSIINFSQSRTETSVLVLAKWVKKKTDQGDDINRLQLF